jgi:hypothetical protein
MSFETNEDEWVAHQDAAAVWARKAPETNPWVTVAEVHTDGPMVWLDAHQFHPWGYNVQELMATPGWPITPP